MVLPAFSKSLVYGCLIGVFVVSNVFGRDYSGEKCLFALGTVLQRAKAPILFSFQAMSKLTPRRDARGLMPRVEAVEVPTETEASNSESLTLFELDLSELKADPRGSDSWPMFETLKRWRIEADGGLSRTFAEGQISMGVDYCDIFETGSDPDKGGHGLGLMFRYSFRK